MSALDLLLGRPLASEEDAEQRVGVAAAAAGIAYVLPLSLTIVALLAIVFFSYRQTIDAYPTVAAPTRWPGFPQPCRAITEDGYLPKFFAIRGRRLVYTEGIVMLAILAGLILIAFGGINVPWYL